MPAGQFPWHSFWFPKFSLCKRTLCLKNCLLGVYAGILHTFEIYTYSCSFVKRGWDTRKPKELQCLVLRKNWKVGLVCVRVQIDSQDISWSSPGDEDTSDGMPWAGCKIFFSWILRWPCLEFSLLLLSVMKKEMLVFFFRASRTRATLCRTGRLED